MTANMNIEDVQKKIDMSLDDIIKARSDNKPTSSRTVPASGAQPGKLARAPITMDMDTGVPPKRKPRGRQGVSGSAALPRRKAGTVQAVNNLPNLPSNLSALCTTRSPATLTGGATTGRSKPAAQPGIAGKRQAIRTKKAATASVTQALRGMAQPRAGQAPKMLGVRVTGINKGVKLAPKQGSASQILRQGRVRKQLQAPKQLAMRQQAPKMLNLSISAPSNNARGQQQKQQRRAPVQKIQYTLQPLARQVVVRQPQLQQIRVQQQTNNGGAPKLSMSQKVRAQRLAQQARQQQQVRQQQSLPIQQQQQPRQQRQVIQYIQQPAPQQQQQQRRVVSQMTQQVRAPTQLLRPQQQMQMMAAPRRQQAPLQQQRLVQVPQGSSLRQVRQGGVRKVVQAPQARAPIYMNSQQQQNGQQRQVVMQQRMVPVQSNNGNQQLQYVQVQQGGRQGVQQRRVVVQQGGQQRMVTVQQGYSGNGGVTAARRRGGARPAQKRQQQVAYN